MKSKIILFNFILISFLVTRCDLLEEDQNVILNLRLEKSSFNRGDTLKGTLIIINTSPKTVSFKFSTSCQFGIKIKSGSITVRLYPDACLHVLTSLTLKSGESKLYEFTLLLTDDNDNDLPEGDYTVEVFLLNNNSSIVSKLISIN
jgi:hypothetical protein